jgi:CO dehydrogenase/acetyl-CoA synthase epsilon subunit
MKRPRVLMLTNYYLPCKNSGGPVITMQNIVKTFYRRVDFSFCCLNHDMNSKIEYDLDTDVFLDKETYHIMYIRKYTKTFLKHIINDNNFDIICCFGLYSYYTRIIISNLKCFRKSKIVIFPMGSFSQSAIDYKKLKKELFFLLYRKKLLKENIFWSFTDETEFKFAKNKLVKIQEKNSYMCPDLVADLPIDNSTNNNGIIFISRIMEIKGLYESIKYLKSILYDDTFDIFGPIEDELYWKKCKAELSNSNIKWKYKGVLEHDQIIETFSKYNVFLFFTKGENFGHIVFESLCGGCVPIVPKGKTIWDSALLKIPNYDNMQKDLNEYLCLNKNEKEKIASSCKDIAKEYLSTQAGDYSKLFNLGD